MRETQRGFWLIVLFFAALYLFTARGNIDIVDGLTRLQVTERLATGHGLTLPPSWRPFAVIGVDGRHYAQYAVGRSVASVPFYWLGVGLGHLTGTDEQAAIRFAVSLLNPLFSALVCGLVFLLGRRLGYGPRLSAGLALLYGLGTIAWEHSKDSFEHPQETLLVLIGLLLALDYAERPSRTRAALIGAVFGLALVSRDTAVLFLIPTAGYLIYAAIRERRPAARTLWEAAAMLACLAPALAFVGWYNWVRTGSVFVPAYNVGQPGFMSGPVLRNALALLLSPGRGLFVYQPVLLFSLVGVVAFVRGGPRRRAQAVMFAGVGLLYLALYARWRFWDGGACWGPRYLLAVIPLLVLVLGAGLRTWPRWLRAAALGLAAISVLIQLSSIAADPQIWFWKSHVANQAGAGYRINSDPRYSPLVRQWEVVAEVSRDVARGRVASPRADEFSLGPDFWWLWWPRGEAGSGRMAVAALLAALTTLAAWKLGIWGWRRAEGAPPAADE
jgi:hypothetical protein